MKHELKIWSIILVLTLFSLIVFPGYKVFISDQKIYIPMIYQSLDSSLFKEDFLLSFTQTSYTLFDELIVFLINFFNLNIFYVLLILTLIIRFIYFYSIYSIAFYFTEDKKFSIFSILIFMSGFFIYGTGSNTLDLMLVPRLMSLSLNLLFLALFFKNKKFFSVIPLGLGLLIHPLTSLPFIIFYYISICFFSKDKIFSKKTIILGILPFLFLIFFIMNVNSLSSLGSSLFIDVLWKDIIQFRASPGFISEWGVSSFVFLLLSLLFFIISKLELKEIFKDKNKKRQIYLLIFIPLVLFVLSFISVDLLNMVFFLQLQMARNLFLWKIFITLLFSFFAYNYIKDHNEDFIFNFPLIGIIVSLILKEHFTLLFFPMFLFLWIKRNYNPPLMKKIKIIGNEKISIVIFVVIHLALLVLLLLRNRLDLIYWLTAIVLVSFIITLIILWSKKIKSKTKLKKIGIVLLIFFVLFFKIFFMKFSFYPEYFKDSQLIEACDWIKENTDKKDVFITEPFSEEDQGFMRLSCYRNVFFSYKDGAQVGFNKEYAIEWKKRYELAQNLKKDSENILGILDEYKIDYIFSDHKLDINYPEAFSNSKYFIYKIK